MSIDTTIGFIGTGKITEAIIIGMATAGCLPERLLISRRNAETSARLAALGLVRSQGTDAGRRVYRRNRYPVPYAAHPVSERTGPGAHRRAAGRHRLPGCLPRDAPRASPISKSMLPSPSRRCRAAAKAVTATRLASTSGVRPAANPMVTASGRAT
ncbi:NAD(P)-binding domain-containing protein [Celeribacter sp. ASW11-22]|nr:NAD(P)-binding domain-containing protein [Celeribacter litoreus]